MKQHEILRSNILTIIEIGARCKNQNSLRKGACYWFILYNYITVQGAKTKIRYCPTGKADAQI
jgi:hypothetical protein